MSKESNKILKEISHKLGQLIILWKLSNRDVIKIFKSEVKKDKVSSKILDYADGSLSYSELCDSVADEMKISRRTVERKISTLKEMGFLMSRKEGKEVYYESSGLFE